MNTTHIEVTPGVAYSIHCMRGSDPLCVQNYDATGAPARSYLLRQCESAYVPAAFGILTLSSDGECAWRLTPINTIAGNSEGTEGKDHINMLETHVQNDALHLTPEDRQAMHSHVGTGEGSTCVGQNSAAEGYYGTAIGEGTSVGRYATGGTALGCGAQVTGKLGMAIGYEAKALADYASALGWRAVNKDEGTLLLQLPTRVDSAGVMTSALQLYLIGPGSALSSRYCEGAAGLGAVEFDTTGQIVRRGTIQLFDLLTDHRDDFTPTG